MANKCNNKVTYLRRRVNAEYRNTIDLTTKEIKLFEEHYSYTKDHFRKGRDITERYDEYVKLLNND